jgi:hypothetical protein
MEPFYPGYIGFVAKLNLEIIAISDAAYHDVNHTIMVTLVGQEILRGRQIIAGGVTPRDLLRAADLIGQVADINYLRKLPALFDELYEIGMTNTLKYNGAADLRANYPDFFWKKVRPYIGDALRYLRVTQEGQQWIANLYAHAFSMEHRGQLSHALL